MSFPFARSLCWDKQNKVVTRLDEFIEECFDESGERIDKEYQKVVSTKNCKYCEFKDKKELCDRKMI